MMPNMKCEAIDGFEGPKGGVQRTNMSFLQGPVVTGCYCCCAFLSIVRDGMMITRGWVEAC